MSTFYVSTSKRFYTGNNTFKIEGSKVSEQIYNIYNSHEEKFNDTLTSQPNSKYGESSVKIFHIVRNNVTQYKASLFDSKYYKSFAYNYQYNELRRFDRTNLLEEESVKYLPDVKLLIIYHNDVTKLDVGFTNIMLNNYDISNAYLVAKCHPIDSYWLLPLLIKKVFNVEYVIAPTTYLHLDSLRPMFDETTSKSKLKIVYLSIDWKYLPDIKKLTEYFPLIKMIEYGHDSQYNTLTYYPFGSYFMVERHESRNWLFFKLNQLFKYNEYLVSNFEHEIKGKEKDLIFVERNFKKFRESDDEDVESYNIHHIYIDCGYHPDLYKDFELTDFFYKVLLVFRQLMMCNVKFLTLFVSSEIFDETMDRLKTYFESEDNMRFYELEALRILVDDDGYPENDYYECGNNKPFNLYILTDRVRSLKSLLIHTKKHRMRDLVVSSGTLETFSINSFPKVNEGTLKTTSWLKNFTYYFDFLKEPNDIMHYIPVMKSIEKLTIIGKVFKLTVEEWDKLWTFICKSKNLKKLIIVEKLQILNEQFSQFIPDLFKKLISKSQMYRTIDQSKLYNNNLEYVKWKTLCLPCRIRIELNYDTLFLINDSYIFYDTKSDKTLQIIHNNGNLMKFIDGNNDLTHLHINSFEMFEICFLADSLIKFPLKKEKKDENQNVIQDEQKKFKGYLHKLLDCSLFKPKVITISDTSNCISNTVNLGLAQMIQLFDRVKVIRGSLTMNDFVNLLDAVEANNHKPISIYVIGNKNTIEDRLAERIYFCHKVTKILNDFETPWSTNYSGQVIDDLSSNDTHLLAEEFKIRNPRKSKLS